MEGNSKKFWRRKFCERVSCELWKVWKHLLPSKLTGCSKVHHSTQLSLLYWMPSTWGRGKSASWHRDESIKAFALTRVKDNLPNSWPVTSPSSCPLHLARALASSLTWVTAPLWRPPKVSTAISCKVVRILHLWVIVGRTSSVESTGDSNILNNSLHGWLSQKNHKWAKPTYYLFVPQSNALVVVTV